jgi:hypothetical protein
VAAKGRKPRNISSFVIPVTKPRIPAKRETDSTKISQVPPENPLFRADNVSYQDVLVALEDPDGMLRFESVANRAGNSTCRILLKSSSKKSAFESYWRPIERLGCSYESSTDAETVFSVLGASREIVGRIVLRPGRGRRPQGGRFR